MTPHFEKLANAFIPGAAPSGNVVGEALRAVSRVASREGGLWVGGKVVVTPEALSFVPNGINLALHEGLEAIRIPFSNISSVRREFGWVTGIVVVSHAGGELRFRCFGAKGVAAELASRLAAF